MRPMRTYPAGVGALATPMPDPRGTGSAYLQHSAFSLCDPLIRSPAARGSKLPIAEYHVMLDSTNNNLVALRTSASILGGAAVTSV